MPPSHASYFYLRLINVAIIYDGYFTDQEAAAQTAWVTVRIEWIWDQTLGSLIPEHWAGVGHTPLAPLFPQAFAR